MKYLIMLLLILSGCARSPLKDASNAMRPVNSVELTDSLSRESFFSALRKHIEMLKVSRQVSDPMIFGERKIAKARYISALSEILNHENDWLEWVSKNFDFFEVYGQKKWGEVMSTGYYEPHVRGSYIKDNEFSQAIYSTPNDLISIELKNYQHKLSKENGAKVLYGRIENNKLFPYYSRKEIDSDQKLNNRNLELVWVDPVDAFFIQVQGSGVVEFKNGEKIRVGYDSQNGHTYMALGKFLKDVIPSEKMSMQRIRSHLLTLTRDEQQKILNLNPSYVFFKKLESEALTYTGVEVSSGRTVATDLNFFPKGALAFLDIEEPVFETSTAIEPISWQRVPRLVFDQDIGGAIKGGGRVDLYFGSDDSAAQKAGVMKQTGKLYYLVPRN